jgi:predicted nucleic acid-binding protein
VTRYGDQKIGLTDASLVVLAQRFATRRILTLDRRHFEVVRPVDGGRFTILPS